MADKFDNLARRLIHTTLTYDLPDSREQKLQIAIAQALCDVEQQAIEGVVRFVEASPVPCTGDIIRARFLQDTSTQEPR